jgi:hypothetical protein
LRPTKRLTEKQGPFRVHDRLSFGDGADQAFAAGGEGDHRGGGPLAFGIGDDDRLAALEDGDDGVGGAEVDADCFSHDSCPP